MIISKAKIDKYEPTPRLKSLINFYGKGNFLDVGCGTGAHIPFVKSGNIYCIDIVDEYIEFVRKKFKKMNNVFVKKANIMKLPFKDNFFDFVLCSSVLECLNNKSDVKKAIGEMKRVLKKNGKLMVLVPQENMFTKLIRKNFISKLIVKDTNQPFSTMGTSMSRKELKEFGFMEIRGCLNWVTWKIFNNDFIPTYIDKLLWYFPQLSGALIGIYEKK